MYTVKLSDKQAQIVVKALDFYSRILCGQLEELSSILCTPRNSYEDCRFEISKLKDLLFPDLQGASSYGICGNKAPYDAQVAYDILQSLRHCMAWTNYPKGGIQVDFDNVYKTSNEPVPNVHSKSDVD
jgi:hypothetical protein